MKVDGGLTDLSGAAGDAAGQEAAGYDGTWTAETAHDPFLPLALAAAATGRIELGTGVAVALARSPMTVASTADDLQRLSGGRFLLGLGSQIRPHVVRRFAMPWSQPAARMREFVLALRAIWASWADGSRLDFRGDFYTHTLMTPFFSPGPNPYGPPRVFLAAVGARMAEVAGEVADGLLVHPFTTGRYPREVTLPAVDRGMARSGRTRAGFELSCPLLVAADGDAAGAAFVRQQIAFYGSTPAYRPVLDLHGWGDLQGELHALSRAGAWGDMAGLVDDRMLRTFAVVAPPDDLAAAVLGRFGGLLDRVSLYPPGVADPDGRRRLLAGLRAG